MVFYNPDTTMPKSSYLTERQWSKLFSYLITHPQIKVGSIARLRRFVEAVFWMLRSGAQWRLLPSEYGHWNTVFKRFNAWSKNHVWEGLFDFCAHDPDLEFVSIDTTIVRAHACSAGYRKDSQKEEALGRSRGGFSTKIHAKVDALGNPLKLSLTAGNASDFSQAEDLICEDTNRKILADKGYDSNDLLLKGLMNGCEMVIPPKANRNYQRKYDSHTYKERQVIECFFGKIKHFRRVFSRFDKAAQSFLSFICLASAHVWLR